MSQARRPHKPTGERPIGNGGPILALFLEAQGLNKAEQKEGEEVTEPGLIGSS